MEIKELSTVIKDLKVSLNAIGGVIDLLEAERVADGVWSRYECKKHGEVSSHTLQRRYGYPCPVCAVSGERAGRVARAGAWVYVVKREDGAVRMCVSRTVPERAVHAEMERTRVPLTLVAGVATWVPTFRHAKSFVDGYYACRGMDAPGFEDGGEARLGVLFEALSSGLGGGE